MFRQGGGGAPPWTPSPPPPPPLKQVLGGGMGGWVGGWLSPGRGPTSPPPPPPGSLSNGLPLTTISASYAHTYHAQVLAKYLPPSSKIWLVQATQGKEAQLI